MGKNTNTVQEQLRLLPVEERHTPTLSRLAWSPADLHPCPSPLLADAEKAGDELGHCQEHTHVLLATVTSCPLL